MTATDAAPAVSPSPVQGSERIVALDVVRGLAVLGILVMNVVEFGQPLRAYENPAGGGGAEGVNLWTWYVQQALFDGRMRALFSMLFGAGIVLLGQRIERQGGSATDLLLRRCLWLVPFGIAHRFLLQWTGDILYMYGLLGLIAVAGRKLRARTQIVAGVLMLLAFVPIEWRKYDAAAELRGQAQQAEQLTAAGSEVSADLRRAKERWERRLEPMTEKGVEAELAAMRGDWMSAFRYRWDYHHQFQSSYLYYHFVWDVLGMMLLGMGLGQLGFWAGAWRPRAYVAVIAAGLAAGAASLWWATELAATGFSGGALELRLIHGAGYSIVRLIGGLGWAAVLILLVRAGALRAVTLPLAAVGRMAFSNYVLQTVCCTLLFFGYGLGLYGELSRFQLMQVWAGVTCVQVIFSLVWLQRFRFGPLEWAWRSLTYWRRQPLRRA